MKIDNRRLIIVAGTIISIITIIFLAYIIKLQIEKNTDISNAIHAIVVGNGTELKGSFGWRKSLNNGENVYILSENIDKAGTKYYKVKYENRVGKILADNVSYFEFDKKNEYVLMSDVSKFNKGNQFKTSQDYEYFIIQNSINYVYIRAGGRGYGKSGNFYIDPEYEMFVTACEYLGVPYGFYFLDEALNSKEIDEEIEFIKEFIKNNSTSMNKLPLAIDIEYQEGKGRADNIWDDRSNLVNELITKLEKEDLKSITYTNSKKADTYLKELKSDLWLAYYTEEEKVPEEWYFDTFEFKKNVIGWQFTENGATKSGINESVDLSLVKNELMQKYIK